MRLALLLGTCALVAQADASPKSGKVVRIERKSRRFGNDPRMCNVTQSLTGYCYGKQPTPGEQVSFVDATHTLGQATIDKVDPYGSCKGAASSMWMVHFRAEGTLDFNGQDTATGLLDVTVDPHNARMMTADEAPPNRPLEQSSAFDLDGDGRRDLVFVAFTCDDRGEFITPGLAGPTNLPSTCIEMWYANDHRFERLHADRISPNCF